MIMDNVDKQNVSANHIVEFITETAESRFQQFYSNQNLQKIKQLLDKQNSTDHQNLTYTAGEINAYMG